MRLRLRFSPEDSRVASFGLVLAAAAAVAAPQRVGTQHDALAVAGEHQRVGTARAQPRARGGSATPTPMPGTVGGCAGSASRRSCPRPAHCPRSGRARPAAVISTRRIVTAVLARSTTRPGRPSGRLFTRWAVTARQPTNSRVLSLRGLPNLVGLELVYAIGCRADDQVSVVTGGMRPWVDQLRGCGVGSVTAFDLATLDGVGDAHHVRFARFSVDRVRLAYADVEQERHRDVWDLRLFGQPGRRRLDFTAIRQPWLREATKAWTAATAGRVGEQTLRHRVGSVAVLSAVLAAGARGGSARWPVCAWTA